MRFHATLASRCDEAHDLFGCLAYNELLHQHTPVLYPSPTLTQRTPNSQTCEIQETIGAHTQRVKNNYFVSGHKIVKRMLTSPPADMSVRDSGQNNTVLLLLLPLQQQKHGNNTPV